MGLCPKPRWGQAPRPPTRGSAPGPRWGLRPQTPTFVIVFGQGPTAFGRPCPKTVADVSASEALSLWACGALDGCFAAYFNKNGENGGSAPKPPVGFGPGLGLASIAFGRWVWLRQTRTAFGLPLLALARNLAGSVASPPARLLGQIAKNTGGPSPQTLRNGAKLVAGSSGQGGPKPWQVLRKGGHTPLLGPPARAAQARGWCLRQGRYVRPLRGLGPPAGPIEDGAFSSAGPVGP